MIYPSKAEFVKMAENANLIPVFTEVMADLETPVSAFMKLTHNGYAYLLESVEGGSFVGRYSFLGFAPEKVVHIKGRKGLIIREDGKEEHFEDDQPLKHLMSLTSCYRLPASSVMPPFCGGPVGYLSYDCIRYFERIPGANGDPLEMPDAVFMFANRYLVFDRVTNRIRVVANATVDESPEKAYEQAVHFIAKTVESLGKSLPPTPEHHITDSVEEDYKHSMSDDDFKRAVCKCLEYIKKGDILQSVLSIRFNIHLDQDPFSVYRALRVLNPSPYMFYLKMGDIHLVGSSPETMVKVEGSRITMNPIAGTRPRGRSAAEDQLMEKDLINNDKEAAEHLMLVDLARNDLGRICQPGTVTVSSLRKVERFSHVMHLVSTVEGDLEPTADLLEVIRATFPAGTVSGAPKIRAMEIIEDLETVRRGPYAGLVGYFDYRGNMDSCITIRTIIIKNSEAYIQTGAGIVADSQPEKEYLECRHKAEALFQAIKMARGGEI